MRTGTIFLAVVMIAGIYVLPSIVATFAGSHSVIVPTSSTNLNCYKCHGYILDEINLTTNEQVQEGFEHHTDAAENYNYTTYMRMLGVDYNATGGPDGLGNFTARLAGYEGEEVFYNATDGQWWTSGGKKKTRSYEDKETAACLLCHRAGTLAVSGTHSRYTVTTCTYEYCHGNGTDTSSLGINQSRMADFYPGDGHKPAAAGFMLNSTGQPGNGVKDAHTKPFRRLAQLDSEYVNRDGELYTADYYMCLACHSYTGMSLHIKRPNMVEFFFDQRNETLSSGQFMWQNELIGGDGNVRTEVAINDTSYNDTVAYKLPGPAFFLP